MGIKTHSNRGARAVITTPANESDIVHLEDVIERVGIEKGSRSRADKGYCSQGNRNYLKANELKDGIMYKAVRNKPLGIYQLRFNKMVGQTRFKVERTFAGIAGGLKKAKPGMWGKQKHISSN